MSYLSLVAKLEHDVKIRNREIVALKVRNDALEKENEELKEQLRASKDLQTVQTSKAPRKKSVVVAKSEV